MDDIEIILNNLTIDKIKTLSRNARLLIMMYAKYWNMYGRKNNVISPSNKVMANALHISMPTFYKCRRELVDKGFITMKSQPVGKGGQKPAEISFADWLIKGTSLEKKE